MYRELVLDLYQERVTSNPQLLQWLLFRSYLWLDRSLQASLQANGYPVLSRAESQVMLLISAGVRKQIDIAKALGLTRQAINQTLNQLIERKLIETVTDPDDKRSKVISFAKEVDAIRHDANRAIVAIEEELVERIGRKTVMSLREALSRDWGEIAIFDPIPQP